MKNANNNLFMQAIKEISIRLSGIFTPISLSNSPIFADIYSSLYEMPYDSMKNDKANIRSDIKGLGNDFKKATKEAKDNGEASTSK